jgi:predicted Zn-dependent protease
MSDSTAPSLPTPTSEQRRVAAGQCERANEVAAAGNHDYAIQLLLTCCKLDPGNLVYRQALRQVQRAKYKNNGHGSRFALLTSSAARLRLKTARAKSDHVKALEAAEEILTRNPWDIGAQMDMAEVFEESDLRGQAIWVLEQARHMHPDNVALNRRLAQLYELYGNFKRALQLWVMVRKAAPTDGEAMQKMKDLAASDTIARGQYEQATQAGDPRAPVAVPAARLETKPASAAASTAETEAAPADEAPPPPAPSSDAVKVEDSLRRRIAAEPSKHDAYLLLAHRHRRNDRLDEARAVLTEGLAKTGNHFELAIELADLEAEPFRQNLLIAEARLRAHPEDADLRKLRVRLLKEINARELYLYRVKAERFPTEVASRFEFGVRLLRAGQLDEAIRELQVARGDARYQWRALLYLGHAFKSRSNWRLAQRNFEDALQHLPSEEGGMRKELLFLLAQGAADAGDLKTALQRAEELANLDFSYRDVGRLMDEWQSQLDGAGSSPSAG